MGQISKALSVRFRNVRKYASQMRRQVKRVRAEIPKDVKSVQELMENGSDPLFAVYAAVQNLTSVFSESVSQFNELKEYYDIIAAAEDEYLPSGPPMSSVTGSYFTTWAFFDLRFGKDQETMGTCMTDLSGVLALDPSTTEALRHFQASRMGIYEHVGAEGDKVYLRELLTDDEFPCHVPAGYAGQNGELWYVRLCPPVGDLFDYHVAITTPYILLGAKKSDWVEYLNRTIMTMKTANKREALYDHLKFGPSVRYWPEFVSQAYLHHQKEAVFLKGLPDVSGSRPHARSEELTEDDAPVRKPSSGQSG